MIPPLILVATWPVPSGPVTVTVVMVGSPVQPAAESKRIRNGCAVSLAARMGSTRTVATGGGTSVGGRTQKARLASTLSPTHTAKEYSPASSSPIG